MSGSTVGQSTVNRSRKGATRMREDTILRKKASRWFEELRGRDWLVGRGGEIISGGKRGLDCLGFELGRVGAGGRFSEELWGRVLGGLAARRYQETLVEAAGAFGVSPSSVSRHLVEATAGKLKEFRERTLKDFKAFALFLDTI